MRVERVVLEHGTPHAEVSTVEGTADSSGLFLIKHYPRPARFDLTAGDVSVVASVGLAHVVYKLGDEHVLTHFDLGPDQDPDMASQLGLVVLRAIDAWNNSDTPDLVRDLVRDAAIFYLAAARDAGLNAEDVAELDNQLALVPAFPEGAGLRAAASSRRRSARLGDFSRHDTEPKGDCFLLAAMAGRNDLCKVHEPDDATWTRVNKLRACAVGSVRPTADSTVSRRRRCGGRGEGDASAVRRSMNNWKRRRMWKTNDPRESASGVVPLGRPIVVLEKNAARKRRVRRGADGSWPRQRRIGRSIRGLPTGELWPWTATVSLLEYNGEDHYSRCPRDLSRLTSTTTRSPPRAQIERALKDTSRARSRSRWARTRR